MSERALALACAVGRKCTRSKDEARKRDQPEELGAKQLALLFNEASAARLYLSSLQRKLIREGNREGEGGKNSLP